MGVVELLVVVAFLATIAIVGITLGAFTLVGVVWLLREAAAQRQRRMQRLAKSLDLNATGNKLKGRRSGYRVRVERCEPAQGADGTRVIIKLNRGFHNGIYFRPTNALDQFLGDREIEVGHKGIDSAYTVRGTEETARATLTHPAVVQALSRARKTGARVSVSRDRVVLERDGNMSKRAGRMLALGIGLASALEQARMAPWVEAARTHGLKVKPEGHLVGEIDGVEVYVREAVEGDVVNTQVFARLPAPLTKGTEIVGGQAGEEIGDLILDGRVSVHGDADDIRGRLTDELRTALLEVLAGRPGSTVEHDRVILRIVGRAMESLDGAIRDAANLAAELAKSESTRERSSDSESGGARRTRKAEAAAARARRQRQPPH